MKAKFFFLGLCALALAACSIDEVSQVNDTNAIQFKATTATRAAAVTTNTIQEFTVWAWNDSNRFMDHVKAEKQSNGTFTTSPYYFWPTGTVDFYALYPVALDTYGTDSDGNELAYLGGEITVGADLDDPDGTTYPVYTGNVATADIQKDNIVIEAYIPGTTNEQIDLCYAITKGRSSGGVPMNFRHALSQVVFKAKDINADFVVDIAEVSICSVNRHGTYTLSGVPSTTTNLATSDLGTVGISDSQGVWSGVNHKTRFEASCTPQTLDTEGNVVNITSDPLLLIPQTVAAWEPLTDYSDSDLGSYIRVLCHVTEHGSQLWPNENEEDKSNVFYPDTDNPTTEYAYIAMPVDVAWAEGYRYTYTIIFGNGLGYYPPDDPNTGLEGTPVLVPITFDVTVDEFQDAEGVDVPTDTDLSYIKVSSVAELEGAVRMGYQEIDVVVPEGKETSNLTLDGYLEFNSDCTLNIASGVTITGPNGSTEGNAIDHNGDEGAGGYSAIIYVNGCNLTITGDGTVTTDGTSDACLTNAIWVVNGTVTVYGGTFVGSNWNYTPESTSWSKHAVYCGEGGYAYLYGGTYSCGYTYVSYAEDENGYWVLNCHNSSELEGHAMIYCYGGTYVNFDPANPSTDDAKSYCANGYGTVSSTDDDGNTLYTVVYTTVTSATDLKSLISEGASDITLNDDIVLEDDNLFFTEDCELNLNGHTLTGVDLADDENPCGNGANSVVFISGGTLTVNGPGTITTEGSGKGADGSGTGSGDTSIFWLNGGDLIINGGTYNGGSWKDTAGEEYTDSSATVYVYSGFAYIYDGTFTCGVAAAFKSEGWKTTEGYTEPIINIWDTARKNDPITGWAYVYGGTYRNFDPGNNPCEGNNTNFCADGYASDEGVQDAEGNTWFTVAATN